MTFKDKPNLQLIIEAYLPMLERGKALQTLVPDCPRTNKKVKLLTEAIEQARNELKQMEVDNT